MTEQVGFDFQLDVPSTAGVDEVGRGPLAGPVVAAAVVLDPARPIEGLKDSKKLTERRREALAAEIRKYALAWSLGRAEVDEIDTINILQASLLAMQRAVAGLSLAPQLVLVDGNHCPAFACPARAIIKGDSLVPAISSGNGGTGRTVPRLWAGPAQGLSEQGAFAGAAGAGGHADPSPFLCAGAATVGNRPRSLGR